MKDTEENERKCDEEQIYLQLKKCMEDYDMDFEGAL